MALSLEFTGQPSSIEETQALVIATLGTSKDVQEIDGLTGGATSKSFILHYNFLRFLLVKRDASDLLDEEKLDGALAERSLLPTLPPEDEFPYSIRLVSEVMSSNALLPWRAFGGSIALMDAGVPVSNPCAGISCGLVTEKDDSGAITKHVVLTDILGAEDHFGDMTKIAGTVEGITDFNST